MPETALTARVSDEALTPRQRQILRRQAQGQTYATIAHDLDLSVGTVRVHIDRAYRRLGVQSLVGALLALGWLVLPEKDSPK